MGVSIWEGGKAERAAAALEAIAETFDVIDDTSGAGDTDKVWSADKIAEELEGKLDGTLKGASGGLAELDANGKVPSSQLPSYVDDVLEYASLSAFPQTGESGKIYISLNDNKTYRWGGSAYAEISQSLALGENSSTAYRGDRGAAAYAAAVTNVDSTPTENSTHLVTSGAVYAGLDEKADKTDVVTDVQVDGTSVLNNGVATIPVAVANGGNYGLVKVGNMGVSLTNGGVLRTLSASSETIKAGNEGYNIIAPQRQHESAFYGLAKAAGDSTQASSSNPVGTYTDNAKSAIRSMIGAENGDDIVKVQDTQPTTPATKIWFPATAPASVQVPTVDEMNAAIPDIQINGTSIVSGGVANIPIAGSNTLGAVKFDTSEFYGVTIGSTGTVRTVSPSNTEIKGGNTFYKPVSPAFQHSATFYGLAKAAGADMASLSSVTVGQYPDAQKVAIQKMLGIYEPPFELLNDITLSERTSINLTADSDGIPYNLLSVFMEIIYPGDIESEPSGTYGRFMFYDSDGNSMVTETGRYTANTNPTYKNMYVWKRANMTMAMFTRISTTGSYGTWSTKVSTNRGVQFSVGNIVRITMNSSDYEPAGTNIKIWGQKAY